MTYWRAPQPEPVRHRIRESSLIGVLVAFGFACGVMALAVVVFVQ